MREISFRAWDKVNKKMIYSPMAICSGAGGWVMFTAEVENMSCYDAIHPIQQYEIMQFTGFKDKNGKPIYEGDIIKHPPYWHDDREVHVVKDIHMFCGDYGNYGDIETEIEVIGNIYEHPELLQKAENT